MSVGSKSSFQNNAVAKKGESATRRRQIKTIDSNGGVTAITNDDESVSVIFNNISAKDIKIHDMGLAVTGNKKVFFDADQDIIEGDLIIDSNSIIWRVEAISAEYTGVFSTAVVRNLSLKGSE